MLQERQTKTEGGGVFLLVSDKYESEEPEEMKVDNDCELIWAKASLLAVPRFLHQGRWSVHQALVNWRVGKEFLLTLGGFFRHQKHFNGCHCLLASK